jgi:DNA-binding response OmpR family regulator
MKAQNLFIYNFNILHNILNELKKSIKNLDNYLVISNKRYSDINNLVVFDDLPIDIFNLLEKINIEFLKLKFHSQSQIKISGYVINLNSREILKDEVRLKLTEKEINTIIYLSRSAKPVNINELQENVWGYQLDIETHTVETHIYRLRKKILNTFKDSEFIVSKKDGYLIY